MSIDNPKYSKLKENKSTEDLNTLLQEIIPHLVLKTKYAFYYTADR